MSKHLFILFPGSLMRPGVGEELTIQKVNPTTVCSIGHFCMSVRCERQEASEAPIQRSTPTNLHNSGAEPKSKPRERLKWTLEPPTHVLSVSPVSEDHHSLRHILNDALWRISVADDCSEAIGRLTGDRIPIVISDSNLPDG